MNHAGYPDKLYRFEDIMNKLAYLLIFMASACFLAKGETPTVTANVEEKERHGALLTVIDRTLDFGKFHGVLPQTGVIRYRNDGDSALYIRRVAPDCGCTVVDFSHEALPPTVSAK